MRVRCDTRPAGAMSIIAAPLSDLAISHARMSPRPCQLIRFRERVSSRHRHLIGELAEIGGPAQQVVRSGAVKAQRHRSCDLVGGVVEAVQIDHGKPFEKGSYKLQMMALRDFTAMKTGAQRPGDGDRTAPCRSLQARPLAMRMREKYPRLGGRSWCTADQARRHQMRKGPGLVRLRHHLIFPRAALPAQDATAAVAIGEISGTSERSVGDVGREHLATIDQPGG